MKKILALLVAAVLVLGAAGCSTQLTDMELLEQTYTNMQELESSKSEGSITIKMMGMTMDPFTYEILYEKPDKTYMKMDADLFGTGEKLSIEFLIQGEEVKLRSDFLDEVEPGLREMMEEAIIVDMENPQDYEEMFMELAEMTEFEVIDNPDGLDAKDYKTFEMTLDSEKLQQKMAEEMNLQEDFLPPEMEELSEEEQALYMQMVEEMLNNLKVDMVATMVVNTKTKHFHKLELDMGMEMPMPMADQMEVVKFSYKIEIEYLEFNTDLEFPEF